MRGPHNNNVHLILSWLVMIHIPTWCSMMYIYNVHMQVPIHGLLHPFQSQNTSTSFKISTTKSEYSQMCDITIQACNGVPDTRMMTSPVCMSSSLHVSALPCPYAMANNIGNFFFDKCHVSPQSHQWLKLIDSCEYYIMMVAVSSNLFFSGMTEWSMADQGDSIYTCLLVRRLLYNCLIGAHISLLRGWSVYRNFLITASSNSLQAQDVSFLHSLPCMYKCIAL